MSAISESYTSRRLRFWLPWISALVFVAGLFTFLIVYNVGGIRNTAHPDKARISNKPAVPVQKLGPPTAPSPAAKLVAARWILTSVGRTNLAESFRLTAPEMRQGLTLEQWKTGNIPVVPYPIGESQTGITHVNWSTAKDVSFEVILAPKKGASVQAQDFNINLRAVGTGKNKHWLVYYWAPRSLPPVPNASSSNG